MTNPLLTLAFLLLLGARAAAEALPAERMSFLENGTVKVGVDLNRGGAITYLSRDGGANIVNNFDLGRQVQLSFYGGPVPYVVGDKHPSKHWELLGWNPIQAGDDWKHGSTVVDHRNDGRQIYIKCIPLQWPLDNVPAECTFETWLELDRYVVKVRGRLNNARSDHTPYAARLQELPALYANAPFQRVLSYTGDHPFTGGAVTQIPKPEGVHPWSFWQATEHWSALLDSEDKGLGLITPGRIYFTGGQAGPSGPNDTHASGTGYLAGQGLEIMDYNITYDFPFELVAGTLAEIRERALAERSENLPSWNFTTNRQGWHYINATDKGWPIQNYLDVLLKKPDPQLIGPFTFWRAEDAPYVIIEAAYQTQQKTATLFWQKHGQTSIPGENSMSFPIQSDAGFHRYKVDLSSIPSYQGGIILLRFDPIPNGSPGEWVRVKSIRLSKSGE